MATEGYGFLFKVKDKKPNGPVSSGKALLNGREVKVAAWRKTAKSGAEYLSLKFEDYEVTAEIPEAADEDIPF